MKPAMILLAALAALPTGAMAQSAAPGSAPAARPAPAPDPRMVAAQQAFEALPEAERRAIQQDLGFATAFNGAALGTFGGLTFNAIQNFEREQKLAVDGILTPEERKQLASIAGNARRALRFLVLDDQRSGAKIGVPQNVFVKRETNTTGGSRWQTADGKATLDTVVAAPGETLQLLFDRATAAAPNRKVTYKLLRPDFFVVTAETATGKSYRRMSLGPDGAIRGFAVGYDKAIAGALDKLVIAVANSYDAFPAPAAATAGRPLPGTAAAAAATAAGVAAAAGAGAPPAQPAAPRERLATGLLLEGGHILTATNAMRECRSITAGPRKQPARVVASDAASGLTLLRADGLPRPQAMAAASAPKPEDAMTVIGISWSAGQPVAVFAEAVASPGGRVGAPLQPGGAGAVLFDKGGSLVGVVTDDPGARRQIAGVAPAARYRFAEPEKVLAFLQQNNVGFGRGEASTPTGGVAAARRDSVAPLVCIY